jgi:importin-5
MLLYLIHDMIFSAMPGLLRSVKLAIEKGQAQGRDTSYLKQLSDYIVPALVEALHKVSPAS